MLVWKLVISPSILNEILAGYSNLGCRCFPLSTLNISCHSLLAHRVSTERSAVKHMELPLYATCCFSLAAFNILSSCLLFVSLISLCFGVFLLAPILHGYLYRNCLRKLVYFLIQRNNQYYSILFLPLTTQSMVTWLGVEIS